MEKQIDIEKHIAITEIKNDLCSMPCDICSMRGRGCINEHIANRLANLGYRKQEWITVEDRLPNTYESVLVFRNGRIQKDYRIENGYFNYDYAGNKVTHWMPLPTPPKIKGAE